MCVICGVPLINAGGPQSEDERDFIRERVEQCESKEQIKAALVDEYGDGVLAVAEEEWFRSDRLPRAGDRRCSPCWSRSSSARSAGAAASATSEPTTASARRGRRARRRPPQIRSLGRVLSSWTAASTQHVLAAFGVGLHLLLHALRAAARARLPGDDLWRRVRLSGTRKLGARRLLIPGADLRRVVHRDLHAAAAWSRPASARR